MKVRVLESGNANITQDYSVNHKAIDIVGISNNIEYIIAHSDGKVTFYQDGFSNLKGSVGNASYGNCIKIEHGNGYSTLYAHMQKGLFVNSGARVKKGQRLGVIGDSGNAYGKHLHFEVRKDDNRINPISYLNNDLYSDVVSKYKVGEVVTINGVFVSSSSEKKLVPSITNGTITRIVDNARNPYLLDNGNIGWVNNNVIVNDIKYLSNKNYRGSSIVEALNGINVDSSFNYRSRLANANGISNYTGTTSQNIMLLNKLKQGTLVSV